MMKKTNKIPRIIKIESVDGHNAQVMFNNGESRMIDFMKLFKEWGISKKDVEYPLLDENQFKTVTLNNYTLSWPSISTRIKDENNNEMIVPYEIGADVLFSVSEEVKNVVSLRYGNLIKKARLKQGITQEQLAQKSGTTRFYISKIENNRADIEMSTFRKIVEAGLGKKLKLIIE